MLNAKQKKNIILFILLYVIASGVFKVALHKISPLIVAVLICIVFIPISLAFIKKAKGNGISKILNISFIVLLGISFFILLMNIVVIQIYPTYARAHKSFFGTSMIVFTFILLLSCISGVLSKVKFKK